MQQHSFGECVLVGMQLCPDHQDQAAKEEYRILESIFNMTSAIMKNVEDDLLDNADEMLKERLSLLNRLRTVKSWLKTVTLPEREKNTAATMRTKTLMNSINEMNHKLMELLDSRKRNTLELLKEVQNEKMLHLYKQ